MRRADMTVTRFQFGDVVAGVLALALTMMGLTPAAHAANTVWQGGFVGVSADTLFPKLNEYATLTFTVSNPLSSAQIHIVPEGSTGWVKSCSSGTTCVFQANPVPGASLTYHAEVWVASNGQWVKHSTSNSITVWDLTADQLADRLLNDDQELLDELLGVEGATPMLVRELLEDEATCLEIGAADPTHAGGSSATTTQLACASGSHAMLTALISAVGATAALAIIADAILNKPTHPATNHDPNDPHHPDNDPSNPNNSGGTNTGSGQGNTSGSTGGTGTGAGTADEPGLVVASGYEYFGSDYWGGLICRATHVDQDTGEVSTYELWGDRLRHIVGNHVAYSPAGKSTWDLDIFAGELTLEELEDYLNSTTPDDFETLSRYLCDLLATGTPTGKGESIRTPTNSVLNYTSPVGIIGTIGTSGLPTTAVSIIVTSEEKLWSAYPGNTEYTANGGA